METWCNSSNLCHPTAKVYDDICAAPCSSLSNPAPFLTTLTRTRIPKKLQDGFVPIPTWPQGWDQAAP